MKPKVGIFDFTGCEGCELQIVNMEDEILDLLGLIEPVNWREAVTEQSDDYDIAIVEGAITRPGEVERLQKIRENAKVLVALGACAHLGGVNCLKNHMDPGDVSRYVYGEAAGYFDTFAARPLSAVVKVDYAIPGCPVDKAEVLEVLKALLVGKKPPIPNHAVCVECKMADNVCVFDKGMVCLGPVTRAGCGAICPSYGNRCEGCRGLVEEPNVNGYRSVLTERGLTVADILAQFRLFDGYLEVAKS